MGLQESQSLCPYARLPVKGITPIQASNSKSKTELTAPTCKSPNGVKAQYATDKDTSPPLSGEEAKCVEKVAGPLLYYARAVDSTILPALSAIATKQAKPREKTKATIKQLLDYCTTQDKAVLAYKASKMILALHREGVEQGDTSSYPTMMNSPSTSVQFLPTQQ